jgi:hypothetical protein
MCCLPDKEVRDGSSHKEEDHAVDAEAGNVPEAKECLQNRNTSNSSVATI